MKQPVWIHSDISNRKHVPSLVSEFTPRSTVRLQKLIVARLAKRFVAPYETRYLLTCLHILALTFTWPISPQSIPKKHTTLPYITRSTKCSLSLIHSHIHTPHVSAIQLLFQHVKVVLRYTVSLIACEQATTTSAGCVENLKGLGIRNFTSRLFWKITERNLNFIMSSYRLYNIDINLDRQSQAVWYNRCHKRSVKYKQ
jgi:hypothetical protein